MGAGYHQVYGMRERAFEPEPDARFLFPALSQRKAISAVSYGLNRGAGVVTVTGAEGLGKSSLLAHLTEQLAGQPVTLARLAGGDEPLAARAVEAFGLEPIEDDSHALAAIEAFLYEEVRRGQRALLLIDDGQDLAAGAGEEIAALAALHHGERSLLQIVLTGDEELAQRLAEDAEWAAVRGRTVASHALAPMLADEVEPYLRHRLLVAGWQGHPALDPGLAPLMHEATGGVPAAINRAMSALLDRAAETADVRIDGDGLAAWLEGELPEAAEYEVVEPAPEGPAAQGLTEAQLEAIEGAFAEHDRMLNRLRRELSELRDRPVEPVDTAALAERLDAIEQRLDQQDQALKHMLQRLIAFFEGEEVG